MTTRVIIAGAGVGGLTAAHELAKREGLEIHVYEKSGRIGGKAASQQLLIGGHPSDALGEHGFRFFPWFYRHAVETLKEIPHPGGGSVHDHLAEGTHAGIAFRGALHEVAREPGALDVLDQIRLFFGELEVDPVDAAKYLFLLMRFWSSCEARKIFEYDRESWADHIKINTPGYYGDEFRLLISAVPEVLAAMRPQLGSARTIGNASLQLLTDLDPETNDLADAVLTAPTDHAWLAPWRSLLDRRGVRFHFGEELTAIELDASGRRVARLRFRSGPLEVAGDYFVCALPVEAMRPLLVPIEDADPSLRTLRELIDEGRLQSDMIGIQYVLRSDLPLVHGHIAFPESDWALTAVSQRQFWRDVGDFPGYFGVPQAQGVLSVIASNWHGAVKDPHSPVAGRTAAQCTREEVTREIWRQLRKGLAPGTLADEQSAPWLAAQLDEGVQLGPFHNPTPLLVHPPGAYLRRPESDVPFISNLFLASDYVRTTTDLASMEGANEAGRRAARAILRRFGVESKDLPALYEHPMGNDVLRELDCLLYAMRRPTLFDARAPAELELPVGMDLEIGLRTTSERAGEAARARDEARESLERARRALPLLERFDAQPSQELLEEWLSAVSPP